MFGVRGSNLARKKSLKLRSVVYYNGCWCNFELDFCTSLSCFIAFVFIKAIRVARPDASGRNARGVDWHLFMWRICPQFALFHSNCVDNVGRVAECDENGRNVGGMD